ncbi:MAG: HypC/HybG/HupF family hydrogenase formation chaperone [Candidatus Njordarchaeia archaeon]
MCLGIPAKVLEVKGDIAVVDINGMKHEVDKLLMPDVNPGDYVIIHAGAIIGKISEREYLETLKTLKEIEEAFTP